tara:strand:+ start:68 stop:223 length:156 start_codon:yes stop_codon:yes gene_type:complete
MKEKEKCPWCTDHFGPGACQIGTLWIRKDPDDEHFNFLQCDVCDSTYPPTT